MPSKYKDEDASETLGNLPVDKEDALEQWLRLKPQPEPPQRQRKLDTCETDWSAWNDWCDARIEARRSFDRAVLVEVVAELKAMIEDQDEKLKVQAENIRSLELKLAELRAANDLRSAEDGHTSVKLAEHQIAIDELRNRVVGAKKPCTRGSRDRPQII
jgi:hypothetical protein